MLLHPQDPPGTFPYRCNPVTMDLGHILYSNVTESLYFTDDCALLETFEDVVDEIYARVDHLGALGVAALHRLS